MAADWFCRIRGQLRGPLSPQDLKALATAGQLAPDSLVRQGMAGAWVKAGRVKGLFQAGAAGDAKSRPTTTPDVEEGSSTVVGLPDLGSDLDNLEDLPDVAAVVPIGLPMGRVVAPVLDSAHPAGGDFPGGTSTDFEPRFGDVVGTRSGHQDATRRDRLAGAERGGFSQARVMSVGIVAVVFGLLGLAICSFVTEPMAPVAAIVLGIMGLLMALRTMVLAGRRHTLAMTLAGVAVVLAVGAGAAGLYSLSWGQLHEQLGSALSGSPAKPSTPSGPLSDKLRWHEAADEVAVTGDLHIQITGVGIGPLPGRSASRKDGDTGGEDVYLMVSVRLQNISKRKVDYLSYSGTIRGGEPPVMRDDLGSNYGRMTTPGLAGQLRKESLYPGDANVDLIVFERPVPNYRRLELTLPGSAFGETEPVRFQIPRAMVNNNLGSATPPPKPKVVEIRSEGEDKVPVESPEPTTGK
ncbi:MAG: DUF4339 domain-containing protein [Planctomycetes bacterium]|nr:DUF4339 domain-containing protein [Planctomycetota bacterium]